jgi:hypothetical protein
MQAFSSAPFFVAATVLARDGFCFASCFFAKSALEKFYSRRHGLKQMVGPWGLMHRDPHLKQTWS